MWRLAFSGIVYLAFFVMFDGVERPWVVALEYSLFGAIVLIDFYLRKDSFNAKNYKSVSVYTGIQSAG